MSYTFDWLSKDVVKKLQGRDLRPVKCLSDATKFCLFNILQETSSRLALKTEYIPVGFTLLHLLEPNIPVPEPEVSAPIPLKHTISQKLKADLDVETIAGGEAGFVKSCGYDIEVQSKSIPNPKLESLQNRKLLDQLPTFMKTCWKDGKNLYVVTEAYEVTKDTVLEGKSNSKFAIKGIINQLVKVGGSGQWQTEKTDSIHIQKGSVLAYKKQQLVIEDNTCVILTSANAKKKMTFPMRFVGISGHLRYQDLVIETGSWINDIDPIGTIKEPAHLGSPRITNTLTPHHIPIYHTRKLIHEHRGSPSPKPNNFMCLQNEVSEQTRLLAELSKDVQEVVFSSFLHMLCDRDVLYDLMKMLELNQLGHMDGPGGKILDELRKDSSLSWINLKDLILYLLQALMVLSDTQLCLLALSVEMRLLPHQVELVKSILQPNFKYPWNIPFTLQPQLLAPLQGEGLAITYELLEECGLKMELNNPRSTWDLEAKMPLSALYGSLSFLQQLSEA